MTKLSTIDTERGRLTRAQLLRLAMAVDPGHVEQKRGMSYMAQYEVRAELTRIFGYGNWDTQVEEMTLLYETLLEPGHPQYPKNKSGNYWVACYRASVRLTVRDYEGREVCSFVEFHAEENAPLPNRGEAHAMAMTSVESYALRRAAIGLGDRFGLGLYNKGSLAPLVLRTLQLDDPESPQFYGEKTAGKTSTTMRKFREAQSTVQEQRDAARDPMVDRLQAGLKVDEAPDA